ncbi:MAG: hypothetical protein J6T10_30310 [Methanobrevibacter sp.]|nr:hypothetical protein [Methanobrevibacter sp.]
MFNKYLLFAVILLSMICLTLYNLWDNTKIELNNMKAEKILLEQELKRRDENEKNLSKRIIELAELYNANADWANSSVPNIIVDRLSKSCKSCK